MGSYTPRVPVASRTPANQQSAGGVGFPQRAGRYRPGGPSFLSQVYWVCKCMEGLLIRGWHIILPGCRWRYEPQVGVSTPCGAVSTHREPPLSSLARWSCRCMKGFLIWRWHLILPGWGWLYEPQVEVSTPCKGGIDPGDHRFRPSFVGVVDVWKDF